MSRRGVLDVVVVGAGVVGAAAALALARDGLAVGLVEPQQPAVWNPASPDLRVYAFAPDNAALLDDLGVWRDVVSRRVQPYRAMQVWDAGGGKPLRFDADRLARRELGWIVEHGLLVDRLWAALPAAGVQLHCPDRITGLQQGRSDGEASESPRAAESEVATLELESGLRLRTRLVIAADGADSPLRKMAGVEVDRHDYQQRAVVAFVETAEAHRDTCWQRFLPSGPLAFLPFAGTCAAGTVSRGVSPESGGHCSSIVWTLPEADAQRLLDADDAAFMGELQRAFDGPLGAMRNVSKRAAFPLRRQLAKSCVAGRVLLIGDAAHVVHPLAGQGVNLGLRDVSALRATIASAVSRGSDVTSAARWSRWARERRSANAIAAYGFEGLNRLFSDDAVGASLLRGPAMGVVGLVPPLTRALWKHAAGL
ncbi:MAG: FAD-dependent oxidoreductase [Pseudomonadota bacterium]|nr:FAD-dependent oxidoreductase [Pseudomonadota bacterium]